MSENQWSPWQVPPDLTPRMLCVGGPLDGDIRPAGWASFMPDERECGFYERMENRGGAWWQWMEHTKRHPDLRFGERRTQGSRGVVQEVAYSVLVENRRRDRRGDHA